MASDAPWIVSWMRLGLLGADPGESSLVLFWGMSSFCLTGTKIPNVVGFGTFPNVVGLPSLRAVSRIRIVSCAFYGGGLDRALYRKGPDCALDWLLDWLAGAGLGAIELGAFFRNVA